MAKKLSKKADIDFLNSIHDDLRFSALRFIYREGLIKNSKVSEKFLQAIKLKDDSDHILEYKILCSVYNSFTEEFQNFLDLNNDFLLYKEEDLEVKIWANILSDSYNNKWVLFGCSTPFLDAGNYNKGSVYSSINNLNKQPYLGVWVLYEKDNQIDDTITLCIGFTTKLDNWTSTTDKYASNMVLDFYAVSNNLISDGKSISKAEEKIKLDLLWYHNNNPKKPKRIISEGINNYLDKINPDLRDAIEVKEFNNYFRIRLPLKGINKGFFCDLYLGFTNHDILGPGMNIRGNLPGFINISVAEVLVSKLNNSSDKAKELVHTTPKLIGRWVANDQNEEKKCSISFFGFIHFNEENNFTLHDHIEGLVKELCVSWQTVDEHLFFDSIDRERDKNV